MLIGQAGDKMYITECIVINKSFKIINNFNDINCMLMILNFNTNFICVLCWKNLLLFYQITSILVKFKSAMIFFIEFVTWAKTRAVFFNLGKKTNYFVSPKQPKYNSEEHVLGKIMHRLFYYRNYIEEQG